eukprot:GEMP01015315.1.p1 GENE.GEMP01015315.1~~GEMP01015315.1.p1  ORF type:complete len:467 (+),score=91.94 GEMP01015315.1:53-1402(+)
MDQLPEDYRERQRKKWEQSNAPTSNAATPAGPSSGEAASGEKLVGPSSSSSAVPAASPPASTASSSAADSTLRRLHLLPLTNVDGKVGPEGDLTFLAPILRQLRGDGVTLESGIAITVQGWDYVVVGVEPSTGGAIGAATEFFLDGEPVRRFEKVQFLALSELDSSTLFNDFVRPRFQPPLVDGEECLQPNGLRKFDVVQTNQNFDINKVTFSIAATLPHGHGIIDKQSLIYVEADSTPEFEKVHVVPFHDTLPRAYEFDIFNDYVKPFFKQNQLTKFHAQDCFIYQGVQFKVVCCEPSGPRRVGKTTTIYCEGVLHPSLRNLLPPELLLQLSYLPPGLQMLLLNTDAIGSGDVYERLMDVQEMLAARRGMANDVIEQIEHYEWKPQEGEEENGQKQCMVCLSDFEADEAVRKLPCTHVFHCNCIDEWLRRCTDCPICKMNIDRRVRNY